MRNSKKLNCDLDEEPAKAGKLELVLDWLHDIWWKRLGGWRLKQLKISISNLIGWFPIIWKDRDCDDHFIWQILKYKLTKQADYIAKRDFHTRAGLDAKRMRLCASLIDKVQDEFYSTEYVDYQETDWKFLDLEDKPGYVELQINLKSERFDEYFAKW